MNVEIGTEAAQFLEKEYIDGIFLAEQLLDKQQGLPMFILYVHLKREMLSVFRLSLFQEWKM